MKDMGQLPADYTKPDVQFGRNDLASQLQDKEQRQSFKSDNDSVPSMQDLAQPNMTTPAVRNKKGSVSN
uniref:Uncharacterized protein n=1 Tax=Timema cristinae TaxID=61476 RepID=A0A7R9D024_TIMCR|nr:unnamed protein product [Timema cristinae]